MGGSVLLRDKKNPDIAIFSNVEQIQNKDFTWKPTIIEAYNKNFGDKFKLISEDGPVKTGGVDVHLRVRRRDGTRQQVREGTLCFTIFGLGRERVHRQRTGQGGGLGQARCW